MGLTVPSCETEPGQWYAKMGKEGRMKIIGVTGGIGTGKSTLLGLLQKTYGAYIVETDKLAHELMSPGYSAYEQIVDAFGTGILTADDTIDRGKLGAIVFQNESSLKKLNEIVHPVVKEFILQDIQKKRKQQTAYYVIEAALLIEDGYEAICDELWYVYVEREERIRRLLAGRGGNREKWEQVMNNQASEDYYRSHCDVVIDNGKSMEETADRINELLCSKQ